MVSMIQKCFLFIIIMTYVIINKASFCGKYGVPYSFEVLSTGAPVLGCAQPSCIIVPEETFVEDSEFLSDVNGQPDGYFRSGDRNPKHYRYSNPSKFSINCSGNFNELSCPKKNQWVGGIEYIDHPRQPLILQCCTYEGLQLSQEVGSTVIGPGETITGGEVIRNGRQISFDVISNVKKVVKNGSSFGTSKINYEVTVRRMNCLPDPPESELQYEKDILPEISKVLLSAANKDLGTIEKFKKKSQLKTEKKIKTEPSINRFFESTSNASSQNSINYNEPIQPQQPFYQQQASSISVSQQQPYVNQQIQYPQSQQQIQYPQSQQQIQYPQSQQQIQYPQSQQQAQYLQSQQQNQHSQLQQQIYYPHSQQQLQYPQAQQQGFQQPPILEPLRRDNYLITTTSFPTFPSFHTFPLLGTFPTLPPHTFPTFPTHTFPPFPTFAPIGVTPVPARNDNSGIQNSAVENGVSRNRSVVETANLPRSSDTHFGLSPALSFAAPSINLSGGASSHLSPLPPTFASQSSSFDTSHSDSNIPVSSAQQSLQAFQPQTNAETSFNFRSAPSQLTQPSLVQPPTYSETNTYLRSGPDVVPSTSLQLLSQQPQGFLQQPQGFPQQPQGFPQQPQGFPQQPQGFPQQPQGFLQQPQGLLQQPQGLPQLQTGSRDTLGQVSALSQSPISVPANGPPLPSPIPPVMGTILEALQGQVRPISVPGLGIIGYSNAPQKKK